MLDALKKKLGIVPAKDEGTGLAAPEATAPTFTIEELQEVVASNTSLEAALAEATAKLASVTATLEAAQAALAEVEATKAQAVAEAKAVKMAARKAAVVAVVGDAKAEAFMAATENLDDAAFEAVSSALAGSVATEATSPLFTEVGVDAQADSTKPIVESAEMRILKAKYQTPDAK